jgi:ABC-type branched-subunit amino acid transport system ATPase component
MRSIERGGKRGETGAGAELLHVEGLDVYYGQAHAVQSASLTLDSGVLAVVGRNGMGKSTLCKAITGMVPAHGTVQLAGHPLLGLSPDEITHLGVAYVPQGRRVWRSLTVDETLRLASTTARRGAWTVERVYQVFPRLAERRNNGGAQLSGGEQQMLAIGRALMFTPRLMLMDEPTEGLAPVIVEQVATLLKALAAERTMAILLVEQNLGVALEVADRVAIMVNGRIARTLGAQALAADRELQQRLLGMRAAGDEPSEAPDDAPTGGSEAESRPTVLRLVRAHGETVAPVGEGREDPARMAREPGPVASRAVVEATAAPAAGVQPGSIYLAGRWEQQAKELVFAKRMLERGRWRVTTVELSDSRLSSAQVDQAEMLRHRSRSGAPDSQRLFADYLGSRRDVAGLMVIADGETFESGRLGALALPTGIPKFILGNGNPGLAGGDVCQLNVPMAGLNRVTETLIGQASAALTAMADERAAHPARGKPLVCITALDAVSATPSTASCSTWRARTRTGWPASPDPAWSPV